MQYVRHTSIGADYSALFYFRLGVITYLGQVDRKLANHILESFRNFDVTGHTIIRNGKVRILENLEDIIDILA